MSVLIRNDQNLPSPLTNEEIIEVVNFVLASENVTKKIEVSISIVNNDEIHQLNRQWRGIDKPTDVLSFECDSVWDNTISDDDLTELGDVIIAPDVIVEQAKQFGNTPQNEMRLMLVHGMLHLLGYDHIIDDEAQIMESREDEILAQLLHQNIAVGPTTRHIEDTDYTVK